MSRPLFVLSNDSRETNACHESLTLKRIQQHQRESSFSVEAKQDFFARLVFHSIFQMKYRDSFSDKKSFKWHRLANDIINILCFKLSKKRVLLWTNLLLKFRLSWAINLQKRKRLLNTSASQTYVQTSRKSLFGVGKNH